MSNDKIDLEEAKNLVDQLQSRSRLPSEEALKSELSRLDKLYTTTVKTQLEQLRKTRFIGTTDEGSAAAGDDASCSVKMTSQYEVLEVLINPNFLLNVLNELKIDTQKVDMDQLLQTCIMLGESVRFAFNNAREKTHAGSEKVFNDLMKEMQTSLFSETD
jgi:DNA-binding protein YbaB